MINDSDKFSERIGWLESLFTFDDKKFTLIFWSFSILTIPIFAYVYGLSFTLVFRMVSNVIWADVIETGTISNAILILSFFFAFGTQFYIWKAYKNKKAKKQETGT